MRIIALILISALTMSMSCKTRKKATKDPESTATLFTPQFTPGPPAFIYKTKKDYGNMVPVLMNDDKTEIVSYPHPTDLYPADMLLLPTPLNNGYILDNKGINKNVAFLNITYQEYAKLTEPPTLEEMKGMLLDINPLTELCDCGNKNAFDNIEKQLNELIDAKQLRTKCKVIK
ncbi:MAG: hypothetical protein LC109_13735 [Bacteroidia bacterium]|nr:hypothetical protein [Bacteroidia bacterium]MCO5254928.1 hypothetical protein [Bacteroidota bacterium]MCZ2131310.1 hypothetical protein [Bacteroidia bacterium]